MSVIFVDAVPDLGQWAKVPELTEYFDRSGVQVFYFHPRVHGDAKCLASWIYHEKVNRGRQVVVAGWSYGMVNALDALKVLERQSVCIDTLISIDCFCLNFHRGRHLQPPNAERVVLIYREIAKLPVGFNNPVVCRIDTCNHLGMPGHSTTVNALFRETLRLGQMQTGGQSEPALGLTTGNCTVCGKPHHAGAAPAQQVSMPRALQ